MAKRQLIGRTWMSGYVTTGGTEGSEYGLLLARTLLPDAMTYVSQAAHYSGPKLLAKLGMPAISGGMPHSPSGGPGPNAS